jgi:hypothetical protein
MSEEEAFEYASDLVLTPAEKDPLQQKGQPISKQEREAIYRRLDARQNAHLRVVPARSQQRT